MDEILSELRESLTSYSAIAGRLKVDQAHVANYFSGRRKLSPTLRRAMYKEYPELKPIRIRSQVTWESQEQKQAVLNYIERRGHSSLTEYLRSIAKYDIAGDEYFK